MVLFPIKRHWVVLGLGLLFTSGPLHAAPSLSEMVDAALARNPGVELAVAERGIAEALQRKADHPLAGAPTANIRYQTDGIGADLGYREWEGGIELPLWLPGQADGYALEAGRTREVAGALHDARRLETAGEVRERLWTAAIARIEAEQAQAAVDAARQLRDDVRRRVSAGELSRSEGLLAEKELATREETLQQAETRAQQASRLFARYTGFDLPMPPAAEQAAVMPRPTDEHPRLRLAQHRVEQARSHRDRVASTRGGGPTLWVGGKTSRPMAGSGYDSAVGVELSMPFGGDAHSAPELAEAESALTQAQVEQSATRLALEDALTSAELELERARAALANTERRGLLAEQGLAMSRRAFELGETDLIRLLQAQADALAARHDLEIRKLELGQASARLNQTLGVIPQ